MAYRDDRDALHARNEALQAEVLALREERERAARAHEALLEAARQGVRITAHAPGAGNRVNAAAVGALLLASVSAFAVVMTVRAGVSAERAQRVLSASASEGPALAVWHATVKSSSRADLPPGTACTIAADLGADGTRLERASSTVFCGAAVLYEPSSTAGEARFVFDAARGVASVHRNDPALLVELDVQPGALGFVSRTSLR